MFSRRSMGAKQTTGAQIAYILFFGSADYRHWALSTPRRCVADGLGRAITCIDHMTRHEPRFSAIYSQAHRFERDTSPLLNTMFKGILPPRRVPSSEFIIVSPLVDNGKENLPSPLVHPESSPNAKAAAAKSAKAVTPQDKSKRSKGEISRTATVATSTDREFDRLLVRARDLKQYALLTWYNLFHRMTSKYHLRSALSLPGWSLLSRLPCSSHLRY